MEMRSHTRPVVTWDEYAAIRPDGYAYRLDGLNEADLGRVVVVNSDHCIVMKRTIVTVTTDWYESIPESES